MEIKRESKPWTKRQARKQRTTNENNTLKTPNQLGIQFYNHGPVVFKQMARSAHQNWFAMIVLE
jgi:hypothetical protein